MKLPQISRVLVSALGPEDPRWDLCWSVGSSAKVQQDGETCCPSQEWERGSTFYCFFFYCLAYYLFSPPTNACEGRGSAEPPCLQPLHHPTRSVTSCGSRPCSPGGPRHALPTQNKSPQPPLASCCPHHAPHGERLLAGLSLPSCPRMAGEFSYPLSR